MGSYCEPCGECKWCHKRHQQAAELRLLKRQVRQLQRTWKRDSATLSEVITLNDSDDTPHPLTKQMQAIVTRINKQVVKLGR